MPLPMPGIIPGIPMPGMPGMLPYIPGLGMLHRLHEVRFGQLTLEHPLHAQLPSGWSPPTAGIPLAAEAALEAAASSGVAPLAMLGE